MAAKFRACIFGISSVCSARWIAGYETPLSSASFWPDQRNMARAARICAPVSMGASSTVREACARFFVTFDVQFRPIRSISVHYVSITFDKKTIERACNLSKKDDYSNRDNRWSIEMANAAMKFEAEEETSLERIALDDAGGDMIRAVELLAERILAEPRIVGPDQLGSWARAWAYSKVHSVIARERQATLRPIANDSFTQALSGAMTQELTRMMDTPLFGGKRLRDATVDEVRESARRYGLLAEDTARKSRWQNLVADAAEKKRAKTIGTALDEKTLTQLWDESDV